MPTDGFRQDTAHLREAGAPDLLTDYAGLPAPLRKAVLKVMVEIDRGGTRVTLRATQ